ncbi:MAG: NAD(P)-dependent alcohol dehydrogenase [Candidatus Eremiobacteraeota bacterium]|nr:NAD(P)-dependent alcohol dehydrogenase [Candidatus Eremiobacteraeota bacterium]
MRAARLHRAGGPENLTIEEIARPEPHDGDVLVRVHAAAFNRRDVFITQGLYPNIVLPATVGSDGAGVVEAAGHGAAWATGDEVVINPMLRWGDDPHVWSEDASIVGMPHPGTFAQYVCVPAENVYRKPAALTMEEAAAIPLAGLTAYRALFTRGAVKKGETVLVPGAGGGVATFVLLFAKAAGARVIVTTGSEEKCRRARALGADEAIDYSTTPDWHKAVRAIGPVDLVVDSSGGDTLSKSLASIRPGGRIVIYGGTRAESTIRLFPLFWNHVDIRGTSMGSPSDFRSMLELFETGLKPVVDEVFAFDDIVAAAMRMASSKQFGKIVVTVR